MDSGNLGPITLSAVLPQSSKRGRFVALNVEGKVVAQDADALTCVKKAREAGCEIPIILSLDLTNKNMLLL